VLGKTDFDFYPKESAQEFFDDEQRIILTGQPLINKLERLVDVDGRESWASVTMVPLHNRSGTVTGIIGISRDVTKLKEAEVAVGHARDAALETARMKSEFLANMSHEIRTPMNAITGMTDLLLDTSLNQEQREFVDTIRSSTDNLLGIISDILDFSKIEAGKLSIEIIDFNLREIIEDAAENAGPARAEQRHRTRVSHR
jgi:signal transduction histidine kinase